MKVEKLKLAEAKVIVESWNHNKMYIDAKNYESIRYNISTFWKEAVSFSVNKTSSLYLKDMYLGIKIYEYFDSLGFSPRQASDDDIWRFLSVKILPDIVVERYGDVNKVRLYEKGTRIWLKMIWWYAYLSWQGNFEKTINILKENTTDEIMHLVDRTGNMGYRIEFTRALMKKYSELPLTLRKASGSKHSLFTKIMKLHTAKSKLIEPYLVVGGINSYIDELLEELKIVGDKYEFV